MSTNSNIEIIKKQIEDKNSYKPFYATANYAESVVTDMDNFPYNRFYRGVYYSSDPIVFEREAGWRSPYNNCYKNSCCQGIIEKPSICWQNACSTILPCAPPKQEASYLNTRLGCINNYR
jgi:hypothetical protein